MRLVQNREVNTGGGGIETYVVFPPASYFKWSVCCKGVPAEGSHTGKYMGALHVQALEGSGVNYVGESFQPQMGFSFPFLLAKDLRTSLLIIITHSFFTLLT